MPKNAELLFKLEDFVPSLRHEFELHPLDLTQAEQIATNQELMRACRPQVRRVVGKHMIELLGTEAPEWGDFLRQAVRGSTGE